MSKDLPHLWTSTSAKWLVLVKRIPKRVLLCLYLTCTMVGACAFFTLCLEANGPSTSTAPSEIVTEELSNKLTDNDSKSVSSYSRKETSNKKIVPPGWSWTPKHVSSLQSDDDEKETYIPFTKHTGVHHRKIFRDNTRYIFLNSVSTTSSSTTSSKLTYKIVTSRTTPVPVPDSCLSTDPRDSKLILLWTSFFDYWDYLPREGFTRCSRCRNCRVTTDRMRLRESDAVIFHARDMSVSDLPPVRYPRQKWVFYCLESPPYSDFPGLQHMRHMFNWTMTYRSDSDIVTLYGTLTKIHPPQKIDMQALQLTFANKSKSVVWMSSHCPTSGGRDTYVKELQKYIDVDIYGTCGTSTCSPGETNKCLQEFANQYKFFLAFENTICKDYITEKFYRTLKYNIIPVVFGGAAYDKFAPPASFIDALSFKSPKHLAFFLRGVGKDFKMYSNYFRWRKNYSVQLNNHKECQMCSLLHKTNLKPSSYEDLRKWWVDESHCRSWKPEQ